MTYSHSESKITEWEYVTDAFAEKPLTIEEKREMFYQSVAGKINWLEEDKNDRNDLIGWN